MHRFGRSPTPLWFPRSDDVPDDDFYPFSRLFNDRANQQKPHRGCQCLFPSRLWGSSGHVLVYWSNVIYPSRDRPSLHGLRGVFVSYFDSGCTVLCLSLFFDFSSMDRFPSVSHGKSLVVLATCRHRFSVRLQSGRLERLWPCS